MPATPPLPFDEPSSFASPATTNGMSSTVSDTATKASRERVGARNPGTTHFSLRYDRLVVAVGAYNQSACTQIGGYVAGY